MSGTPARAAAATREAVGVRTAQQTIRRQRARTAELALALALTGGEDQARCRQNRWEPRSQRRHPRHPRPHHRLQRRILKTPVPLSSLLRPALAGLWLNLKLSLTAQTALLEGRGSVSCVFEAATTICAHLRTLEPLSARQAASQNPQAPRYILTVTVTVPAASILGRASLP